MSFSGLLRYHKGSWEIISAHRKCSGQHITWLIIFPQPLLAYPRPVVVLLLWYCQTKVSSVKQGISYTSPEINTNLKE